MDIKQLLKKIYWTEALVFKGRSTRTEFNINILVHILVGIILRGIMYQYPILAYFIGSIVGLWLFVCTFTLSVRRLHDLNLTGWWMLGLPIVFFFSIIGIALGISLAFAKELPTVEIGIIWVISLLGLIIFFGIELFLMVKRGTKGTNKYGADPREVNPSIVPEQLESTIESPTPNLQ